MAYIRIKDDLPMMAESEIEIINAYIEEYKPKFCLEYGSGNSTVYFPKKHKEIITHWTAVEHNGNYVKYLRYILPDNADVFWVDFEWYIDSVKLGRLYDFIFIDGEYRENCLDNAFDMLNDGGFVLLHDSGRIEYADFINRHNGKKLSEGEISVKEGGYAHRGLTLFTKETL